jgi:hypothetical protein
MKAASILISLALLAGTFQPPGSAGAAATPENTRFYDLPRVEDNTAVSQDGSSIRAFLRWGDFPHNEDRTIYAWEDFAVGLEASDPNDVYDGIGMSAKPVTTPGLGWIFEAANMSTSRVTLNLSRTLGRLAPPDLYAVNFTLLLKPATVKVEAYVVYRPEAMPGKVENRREWYPIENVLLDGVRMDRRGDILQSTIPQGKHTLTFEGYSENISGAIKTYAPPAPADIWVLPGMEYTFKAYWVENTPRLPPIDVNPWIEGQGEDPDTYEARKAIPPVATINICVVPYNPRFAIIPYLCLGWREGDPPQSSYDLPFAVLVRYDGNRYDPENESRLSLDQRAMVDDVSIEGYASWPLRAAGRQPQLSDNGDSRLDEGGNVLYYEEGEVIHHDNGMPKLETATLDIWKDLFWSTQSELLFAATAEYGMPENFRETAHTHQAWYGELTGLALHDQVLLNPLTFSRGYRYHKFVFTLAGWPHTIKSWIAYGEGTLALDVSLQWGDVATIKTGVEWGPLGLAQPAAVRAWRLAPWARELAENDPQVLYVDNAWMVDDKVSFELTFVPVFDAENFLRMARGFTENFAPALGGAFADTENLKNVLENLGIEIPDFQEVVPAVRTSIYSLATMDDAMMGELIKDLGAENKEPQSLSGIGAADFRVERRGLPYFTVEEKARIGDENARVKYDLVNLPFDNGKVFSFDVNLSGEGMAVELAEDTCARLELRVHAPPRSGGLQRVRILDNEGDMLYQREFLPPTLVQMFFPSPSSSASEYGHVYSLTFDKTPSTPAEIYVELTNTWGASSTKKLAITPWAPVTATGMDVWGWLIVAGVFTAAWVAFVNWLKERRARQI